MDASERAVRLLEEIRDLQKLTLEEARTRGERALAVQDAAVKHQRAIGTLYKWVVGIGALVVLPLIAWLITRLG